jgi:hypothetical protein
VWFPAGFCTDFIYAFIDFDMASKAPCEYFTLGTMNSNFLRECIKSYDKSFNLM